MSIAQNLQPRLTRPGVPRFSVPSHRLSGGFLVVAVCLVAFEVDLRAALAQRRPAAAAPKPPGQELLGWLRALEKAVPGIVTSDPADDKTKTFSAETTTALDKAAEAVEQWAAQIATFRDAKTGEQLLDGIGQLLDAKNRVDRLLDATLDTRGQFSALADTPERHAAVCAYLATTSRLIDLSGRLRYVQVDAVNTAGPRLIAQPQLRQRLLARFESDRSSVGAFFATRLWIAPDENGRLPNVDQRTRDAVLHLATQVDEPTVLVFLAQAFASPAAEPELLVSLAETIRRIGLPQEPWTDPIENLPPPPITPTAMHQVLTRIATAGLSEDLARRHAELIAWLETMMKQGLTEPVCRIGTYDVRPGDFLLMRNPSPYNQFTDLLPGLFTHVGVVTQARGSDGIERLVLVDLPERGNRIPAANVEAYVLRSLNYCFLRHPDPRVAASIAQAAHDVIGNESLFDLNFRLQGVMGLKAQPLAGRKIETYCAGLLLLCALQTSAPREEFFPLQEHPRGGNTLSNLAKLGLSMDDDFISPTGALFSPKMQLVGRREPMYDPRREVEEGVFDHFAWLLANRTLVPSPDWSQALRLKLAEASRTNKLLAEALAKAARVNAETDLVSAAKAAAVVETLDQFAYGASGEFRDAWEFLLDIPAEAMVREGEAPDVVADAARMQRRHAGLYQAFQAGQLSRRRLRIDLVKYYTESGKRQLERRFFAPIVDGKRPAGG
ncbi:MAG TPA: hypothetical protein VHC22_19975 [Pirellulales bacterium]|nr:hypothetical protein [Pirellulales bacterium]